MATADTPDGKPLYTQLRKGRWYWEPPLRLRRSHKLEVKPLGSEQSAAWAYARKLNQELANLEPASAVPGTVTWIFDRFFASEKFAALAPATQRDYRWLAKVLGDLPMGAKPLGSYSARAVKARHADTVYAAIVADRGHSAGHYACRFARRVWKWAGRLDFVDPHPNPWASMGLTAVPQRHAVWTRQQVDQVIAAAGQAGVPSIGLAVLIAYWLGHRQSDVLGLTWTALDARERETAKTKARVPIVAAAYPELAAALAAERARQKADAPSTHVVLSEASKAPWNRFTFVHEFRRIARAAGIPDTLQFRDLRATAQTELADSGASVIEMGTHSGHKTAQMARRYARPTAQQFQRAAAKRLAAQNSTDTSDGTRDGTTEPNVTKSL